jgi:hypothetical protein
MATYYVSALAGGGGDGSIGNPWTWNEAATQTYIADDIIQVLSDGVHNASTTFTYNAARVTLTGPSRTNRASVLWSGGASDVVGPGSSSTNHIIKNLIVDGAAVAVDGIDLGNNTSTVIDCTAKNCTNGFSGTSTNSRTVRCNASGCGSGFTAAIHSLLCWADSCTTGFNGNQAGLMSRFCIASNSTSSGFYRVHPHFCIAYNSTVYGFRQITTALSRMHYCIAVNSGTAGFRMDDTSTPGCIGIGLFGFGNPALTSILSTSTEIVIEATELPDDPFVDAANNDFNINDSNGGNALRDAGFVDIPDLTASYWPFNTLSMCVGAVAIHQQGAV